MNKLLLMIFLGFVITLPLTIHAAYAGLCEECGGNFKPTFTSKNGKVMVEPVVGISGESFTLHYQDVVTVKRDTSMDCEVNGSPGTFVPPTSVFLNAGPFSDQFGGGGGEFGATEFVLQPAFALTPGQSLTQQMLPTGNPNEVQTMIGPIIESHGAGPMSFTINCPPDSTQTSIDSFFDIFVDPSGLVLDACTGEPIAGASVELTVDDGSGFMSPDNSIIDPQDFGFQLTFSDGSYGWDVAPFGYDWLVTVTNAPGYQVPQSLGPYTISGPQDAVTDANFFLQPIGQSCSIGGTILQIDSTALLLAGVQGSLAWILPIVLVGAGLAVFVVKRK